MLHTYKKDGETRTEAGGLERWLEDDCAVLNLTKSVKTDPPSLKCEVVPAMCVLAPWELEGPVWVRRGIDTQTAAIAISVHERDSYGQEPKTPVQADYFGSRVRADKLLAENGWRLL